MKKKKIIIELLLFSALTFLFVGCTGKTDLLQAEETETPAEPSVQEGQEESEEKTEEEAGAETEEIQPERREIPIDFSFYGDQKEDKLTLAAPQEGQDEYELIHYDKDGEILQQIPCGRLMEPVTFSFIWNDLQIFSEGSDTGILFIWDDGSFSTTPIEIPRYEEVRYNGLLVSEEDGFICSGL